MTAFDTWATPDLVLTLRGREFRSRPPVADRAKEIIALSVVWEHGAGMIDEVPEDVNAVADSVKVPLADLTLGPEVHAELRKIADARTITRMAQYGLLYWAYGEERADAYARLMWATPEPAEETAPKAPRRSPKKSGTGTASASKTRTRASGPAATASRAKSRSKSPE